MDKKNILFSVFLVSILVICFFSVFLLFKTSDNNVSHINRTVLSNKESNNVVKPCAVTDVSVTVRGSSMGNVIKNGTEIPVEKGYYACNEPSRYEVVIYSYGGNPDPVIKSIKGIPGDTFHIGKEEDGWWYIYLNNIKLKNLDGVYYRTDERGAKIIGLYEHDYNGVIPEHTYLLLGEQATGSLDSRVFGLVDARDFIGRVKM